MTGKRPRVPHYQRDVPFHLVAGGRAGPSSIDDAAARLLETGRRLLADGNERAARAAFEESAQLGSREAALAAAVIALCDTGEDADPDRGLAWLQRAAERGAAGAALLLGRIRLATPGAEADGVRWLQAAAGAGEPEALCLLGLACVAGRGTETDVVSARRLQKEAAARGVVGAQFELSLLLAQGVGGAVDTRAARRWEEKAAEAGHPRACLNRAARLARAKRPDFAAVARWYARAAEGGSADAAARLCRMHLAGQGVPRDATAARHWFEHAAELGYRWDAREERSPS